MRRRGGDVMIDSLVKWVRWVDVWKLDTEAPTPDAVVQTCLQTTSPVHGNVCIWDKVLCTVGICRDVFIYIVTPPWIIAKVNRVTAEHGELLI